MKPKLLMVFLLVVFFGVYFFYTSYGFIFFVKDHQLINLTLKKNFFAPTQKEILVEIAKTPNSTTQGLSNRSNLTSLSGQKIDGLLFIFPKKEIRRFWMKEMLFNLDICWFNDLFFLSCQRMALANDQTKIYSSPKPANLVLETQPGFLSDTDLNLKLFFKW